MFPNCDYTTVKKGIFAYILRHVPDTVDRACSWVQSLVRFQVTATLLQTKIKAIALMLCLLLRCVEPKFEFYLKLSRMPRVWLSWTHKEIVYSSILCYLETELWEPCSIYQFFQISVVFVLSSPSWAISIQQFIVGFSSTVMSAKCLCFCFSLSRSSVTLFMNVWNTFWKCWINACSWDSKHSGQLFWLCTQWKTSKVAEKILCSFLHYFNFQHRLLLNVLLQQVKHHNWAALLRLQEIASHFEKQCNGAQNMLQKFGLCIYLLRWSTAVLRLVSDGYSAPRHQGKRSSFQLAPFHGPCNR